MHTINYSKNKMETKFVQYDQSDKVKSFNGSSVSYAAAISYMKWLFYENIFFYVYICLNMNNRIY